MLFCHPEQFGSAHHCAVLPHNLTAESAFLQSRQTAEINRSLCVSVPLENSVFLCQKGEHVTGTAKILRLCLRINATHCGDGALSGRDSRCGGDVINGDSEGSLVIVCIDRNHLRDLQLTDIVL